ncbi:MAG: UDP-N-acetylmuramoyl-tripeptide--D-alanyl-D-alanine ligase [Acetobacteraceae bacterium]|nr:UDP-N-acetylmuramoyl-tripeptide--D-alanyl-D-alanine ligase [Acetobacteraceae bacterium]
MRRLETCRVPLFTAGQVARAVGGCLVLGRPRVPMFGVEVDSRRVQPGDLFCALAGSRTDGHRFVGQAFERGAAGALVSRWPLPPPGDPVPLEAGRAVVLVDDTLAALGRLSAFHRTRFEPLVVAVTGSVGKTTTKDMAAAVLARRYRTLKTEGNYNTEVGLPLTLLRLRRDHQAAVLEMGMRGRGEIAYLAGLARPRVGVVTNVGPTHLERLGSLEAVAQAKGELLSALPHGGTAVLNSDDTWCRGLGRETAARVLWFGLEPGAEVTAEALASRGLEGSTFVLASPWGRAPVSLPLPGRHQVMNALAAAAVGLALGVEPGEVGRGLAEAEPGEFRMQVLERPGLTILADCYNASPASVRAALCILAEVAGGRRVAVLGDMLELGSFEVEGHREVGRAAVAAGVGLLVTVGPRARMIAEEARAAGLPAYAVLEADDNPGALSLLRGVLRPEDTVLVKGSRALGMEAIVAGLEGFGPAPAAGGGGGPDRAPGGGRRGEEER